MNEYEKGVFAGMHDAVISRIIGLLVLLIVIFTILFVSTLDYQDEIDQQNHYCEMVQLWNDHIHLPEEDRPGWPPYNGEEQCHAEK